MGSRLVALHEASQRWVWRWLYVAAVPWLALAAWGATLGVTRLAAYGAAFLTFFVWLVLVTNGAYFLVLGLALFALLGIGFLRPGFGGFEGTNSRLVVGAAGLGSLVVAGLLFSPTPSAPDIAALSPTSTSQPTSATTITAPTSTTISTVRPATTTTATSTTVAVVPIGPVLVDVIDGDTIKVVIDGEEESVRLIGIDANERGDCFADEATDRLSELLADGFELERDVTNRDQFGRLLRYVLVDGEPVSVTLAKEGLAIVRRYPPDIAFAEVLEAAQLTAQVAGAGIWDPNACGPGEAALALSPDGALLAVVNAGSGVLDLGGVAIMAGSTAVVTFADWFALLPGETADVRASCGEDRGRVVFACAGGVWPGNVGLAPVGAGVTFADVPPIVTTTSMTTTVVASSNDIVISYIHPDAAGNDNDTANKNDEYFDLTNEGAAAISMSGWKVEDEGANHTYSFPGSYVLGAGATVRIHTGCGTNDAEHLYWCEGGSAVWNNDGDTVTLIDPDGSVVDTWGY